MSTLRSGTRATLEDLMSRAPEVRVGERLRFYRQARGKTQAVVAGLAGVTEDYLSQIERGLKTPTLSLLSSWTLCFGDVVWIHTYVELQYWGEKREGWAWITIAGPHEKGFPGITGSKIYNNQWTPCVNSGKYRETGWARWQDSEGETGTTDHATRTATIRC
jgi:DNA-binding XRE family transcriptional regulator